MLHADFEASIPKARLERVAGFPRLVTDASEAMFQTQCRPLPISTSENCCLFNVAPNQGLGFTFIWQHPNWSTPDSSRCQLEMDTSSHHRDPSTSSSNTTCDSKSGSDSQYISSPNSTPPPTLADIDRWRYHIDFETFGKSLQDAANAVFPNDTNCRYTRISVLMLSWEDEDPQLPVSQEIQKLYEVFRDDYRYETEHWTIPDEYSHWKLTEKIMDFVKPGEDSKTHLRIVYYAGHARLTETRLLVWTRFVSYMFSKAF